MIPFLSYARFIAGGAVVAIILALASYGAIEHHHYQSEVAILEQRTADLAVQTANVNSLKVSIVALNMQIAKNNAIAKQTVSNAQKVIDESNANLAQSNARIQQFLAQPVKGDTDCDKIKSVDDDFVKYLRSHPAN